MCLSEGKSYTSIIINWHYITELTKLHTIQFNSNTVSLLPLFCWPFSEERSWLACWDFLYRQRGSLWNQLPPYIHFLYLHLKTRKNNWSSAGGCQSSSCTVGNMRVYVCKWACIHIYSSLAHFIYISLRTASWNCK